MGSIKSEKDPNTNPDLSLSSIRVAKVSDTTTRLLENESVLIQDDTTSNQQEAWKT